VPRLLIVNADDLGLHEDINRGIHIGHSEGIVTSTSLVACGEAFNHASTVIEDCPELDVGVHLTLVEERPLCAPNEIPTLVGRDGRFLPTYRHVAARAVSGSISADDVIRELRAQIERVISIGRQPSHLDSHQHIHLLPSIWRVTKKLATDYGIRWIRIPRFTALFSNRRSLSDAGFRLGLNVLSAAASNSSAGRGRKIMTAGLHHSGRLDEASLLRVISDLRPGISEVISHPGIDTPALSMRYRWHYNWSAELAAVTSSPVMSLLASDGVRLTRFSELTL